MYIMWFLNTIIFAFFGLWIWFFITKFRAEQIKSRLNQLYIELFQLQYPKCPRCSSTQYVIKRQETLERKKLILGLVSDYQEDEDGRETCSGTYYGIICRRKGAKISGLYCEKCGYLYDEVFVPYDEYSSTRDTIYFASGSTSSRPTMEYLEKKYKGRQLVDENYAPPRQIYEVIVKIRNLKEVKLWGFSIVDLFMEGGKVAIKEVKTEKQTNWNWLLHHPSYSSYYRVMEELAGIELRKGKIKGWAIFMTIVSMSLSFMWSIS